MIILICFIRFSSSFVIKITKVRIFNSFRSIVEPRNQKRSISFTLVNLSVCFIGLHVQYLCPSTFLYVSSVYSFSRTYVVFVFLKHQYCIIRKYVTKINLISRDIVNWNEERKKKETKDEIYINSRIFLLFYITFKYAYYFIFHFFTLIK